MKAMKTAEILYEVDETTEYPRGQKNTCGAAISKNKSFTNIVGSFHLNNGLGDKDQRLIR